MLLRHAVERLDHQVGADLVDKIGEQDDQRTPRHLRIEVGQGEDVVGLLGRILERRQLVFQYLEALSARDHRRGVIGPRGKGEGADIVADFERAIAKEKPGIDGAVEPLQP